MYSQRVSSKIGTTTNLGEFLFEWTLEEQASGGTPAINYTSEEYLKTAERGLQRTYKDLGMDSLKLSSQYTFHSIPAFIHGADETEQYYFHPDHLGSSNYITNFVGTVTQHMEYFAFGETFVEEHKNSHNSPYKYNGKELDEETGWYYYGARFYSPRESLWLSVDPLVEETKDAYGYCLQNPVNLIDPAGMSASGWGGRKNEDGTISYEYSEEITSENYKKLGYVEYSDGYDNNSIYTSTKGNLISLNPNGTFDTLLQAPLSRAELGLTLDLWGDYTSYLADYESLKMEVQSEAAYQKWSTNPDTPKITAPRDIRLDRWDYQVANGVLIGGTVMTTEIAVARVIAVGVRGYSLLRNIYWGGKTFNEYKTIYWATRTKPTLQPIVNPQTGQVWKQYTELHHAYIPQRATWAPNWMKNNSLNLKEMNSLEHAIADPYRAQFAPKWVKEQFNLITP